MHTHRFTFEAEVRELPPTPDQHGALWANYEHTGRARATCPCGHDTGMVPKGQLPALA